MAQRSTPPSSSADTVKVNVGTLSSVLAVAIQQASVGEKSSHEHENRQYHDSSYSHVDSSLVPVPRLDEAGLNVRRAALSLSHDGPVT